MSDAATWQQRCKDDGGQPVLVAPAMLGMTGQLPGVAAWPACRFDDPDTGKPVYDPAALTASEIASWTGDQLADWYYQHIAAPVASAGQAVGQAVVGVTLTPILWGLGIAAAALVLFGGRRR